MARSFSLAPVSLCWLQCLGFQPTPLPMITQGQGAGRNNEVLRPAGRPRLGRDETGKGSIRGARRRDRRGGGTDNSGQALGRVDVDAPILAAAAPWAGN